MEDNQKYKSFEEINQHNYFSYLNLRKLDFKVRHKVITVRRTRRRLYRHIIENSFRLNGDTDKADCNLEKNGSSNTGKRKCSYDNSNLENENSMETEVDYVSETGERIGNPFTELINGIHQLMRKEEERDYLIDKSANGSTQELKIYEPFVSIEKEKSDHFPTINKKGQLLNFSEPTNINEFEIFQTIEPPPDPSHPECAQEIFRIEKYKEYKSKASYEAKHFRKCDLSRFIQKENDSSADSIAETEYVEKMEVKANQFEVVHYKPPTLSKTIKFTEDQTKYCNIAMVKDSVHSRLHPINTGVGPVKISDCNRCSISIQDKMKYQRDFLSSESPFRNTYSRELAISNIKKKDSLGRYLCPKCRYKSKNVCDLTLHLRTHNNTPACSVCQKELSRSNLLGAHMFEHLDVSRKSEKLKKIEIKNGNISETVLSVQIMHKIFRSTSYECFKCDFWTKQKGGHIKCEKCNSCSNWQGSLCSQLRNMHERKRSFVYD